MSDTAIARDFLTALDDSKRLVAKLMARENISVQVVDGAPTASFDTVSRVLTIPNWTGVTLDQFDFLIAHEVGHALFTDTSYIPEVVKSRGLMTYFNVVEDARIERKMKTIFPGLVRTFHNAYRDFVERGPILKGTRTTLIGPDGREVPIRSLPLIDRINLHYKTGAFMDVPFTDEERIWLHKIDRCGDMHTALEIARALYELAKGAKEPVPVLSESSESGESGVSESGKSESGKFESSESGETDTAETTSAGNDDAESGDAGDDRESSSDADDSGEAESGKSGKSGDSSETDESSRATASGARDDDDEPRAMTDDMLSDGLKRLAENSPQAPVRHLTYGTMSDAMLADHVKPAIMHAETFEAYASAELLAAVEYAEQRWLATYGPMVRSMALEFERRKNAREHRRAHVTKTGRLDMTKLYKYKFSEDLFLRSVSMPRGQSHGICLMIDGSASMASIMMDVLDQVLLFAHFAYACKIPFEAYMFTDRATHFREDRRRRGVTSTIAQLGLDNLPLRQLFPAETATLVGLINTVTDRMSFRRQVRTVIAMQLAYMRSAASYMGYMGPVEKLPDAVRNAVFQPYSRLNVPDSDLGTTPLYSSMMIFESLIGRMKRNLRLDKMMAMIVTDGENTGSFPWIVDMRVDRNTGRVFRAPTAANKLAVVRDLQTKANHVLVRHNGQYPEPIHNAWMRLFLNIIKERHDAMTFWLFLTPADGRARRRGHHFFSAMNTTSSEPLMPSTLEPLREMFRADQQVVNPKGLADLTLLVRSKALELDEMLFEKLTRATNATSERKLAYVRKIQKAFEKSMADRVAQRRFVNTVIPFIA